MFNNIRINSSDCWKMGEDFEKAKSMRSSRLECLVIFLVWVDLVLISHQLALDVQLADVVNSNSTFFSINEDGYDSESVYAPSYFLFISILVFSALFLLEVLVRLIYNKTNATHSVLDIVDACITAISFAVNLSLFIVKANPLLRDVASLLILCRLLRLHRLVNGLTEPERRTALGMLEAYRREEIFNTEKVQMLQTELQNRERECADLRDLINKATRSRLGKQKRSRDPNNTSRGGDSGHYDSGHSSDSNTESPQSKGREKPVNKDEDSPDVPAADYPNNSMSQSSSSTSSAHWSIEMQEIKAADDLASKL